MSRIIAIYTAFRDADSGKTILIPVVFMLVGLIRSTYLSRIYEDSAEYHTKRSKSRD